MTRFLPTDDDSEYSEQEVKEESRKASPADLLLRMESFSLLKEQEIRIYKSRPFEGGGYKWQLKLDFYPDTGEDKENAEYIGVFISMAETSSLPNHWEVNAIANIFLYNHISDDYLCFRDAIGTVVKPCRFHQIKSVHGSPRMISKKMLMEPGNGFLAHDTCVVGAEVFVIKRQPIIESLSFKDKSGFDTQVSGLNLSNPCKREWKISRYSELKSFWTSEEFYVEGYNWQILMYPNGHRTGSDQNVSIFFDCDDVKSYPPGKQVNASCVFTLRNMFNHLQDHSMKATAWFSSTHQCWGFIKFKATDDMSDPRRGFVVDDCCTLEIQLSVHALHQSYL